MAKKKSKKKAKKKVGKKKKATGFTAPLEISDELAAVIGAKAIPRTEVVKKIWKYIKKHDLQNPKNKRNIIADKKLLKVFKKKEISMFEMMSILNKHLS